MLVKQERTNVKNTVSQFRRFIGKKFDDPEVQKELKRNIPYTILEQPGKKIGIKVGLRYFSKSKVKVNL